MKKNWINLILPTLVIVILMISCLMFAYYPAKRPIHPPGWDQVYGLYVENMDNLKIIFGEDYLYPTDSDGIQNIGVDTMPPDTLYDKRNKIEYMPELVCCRWTYKQEDYEIHYSVWKGVGELGKNKVLGLQGECSRGTSTVFTTGDKIIYYDMIYLGNSYHFQIILSSKLTWEETEPYEQILYDYVAAMRIGGKAG